MAISFPTDPTVRVFHYPGGEIAVAMADHDLDGATHAALVTGCTPDDLVTLTVWAHDVRRLGGRPVGLLPYLPAARADHDDHRIGFDAAAHAALIDAAGLERVVCVDPHSTVMPGLISNIEVIDAAEVVPEALDPDVRRRLVGVIAPDAGAARRAGLVAERLGLPLFQAGKHRDFDTGRLDGFWCEPLPATGDLLVVDDICDGGGTFRGLAAAVPEAAGRLHLWVTHGVFSGDAPALAHSFASITTTDSHPGCTGVPAARIHPLLPTLLGRTDTGGPR